MKISNDKIENKTECTCGHCFADDHNHSSGSIISCGCGCCDEGLTSENKSFFRGYSFKILQLSLSFALIIASLIVESELLIIIFRITSTVICGVELVLSSIKGVLKRRLFNENFLMLTAAVTAFVIGEGFEGALIVSLFRLGEFLECIATDSSAKKIDAISKIKVDTVRLFSAKGLFEVKPETVQVGSLIQVNKGERVPIDGVLLFGNCEFDVKAITGESEYLAVNTGEVVFSGAINLGDAVIIKTTKTFSNSVCQKIVKIVEESLDKKSKCQKFITSFSAKYTPIFCLIAIAVAVLFPLFDSMNFNKWIYKSLAFLVVSCPCALVISVPLAFFTGVGALAKVGILIKSTASVELLSKTSTVVFDKTGTLTSGKFEVVGEKIYDGFERKIIIEYLVALEKYSTHPIAKVVLGLSNTTLTAKNVKEISGLGVVGEINDYIIAVGNNRLMNKLGVKTEEVNQGNLTIYVSVNGDLAGEIYLSDKIKNNCKVVMNELKKVGVDKTAILSGDKKIIAETIAKQIGIDLVRSELLPDEKTKNFELIKNQSKGKIAYVGDGINDSPTLASADVGIAMGGLGSDIAIESADVVVLDDDLFKIPLALKHSKRIMKRVKENIIFSLSVKFSIMMLSVLFTIPMGIAMFADVGVMCLAVLNSIRCSKIKIRL